MGGVNIEVGEIGLEIMKSTQEGSPRQ